MILAAELIRLNPKFFIAGKALPLPALQKANQAGQSPLVMARWFEDIHDPHNWYQPYLQGFFAHVASLPEALRARYAPLIDRGVHEIDPARRAIIYRQLNQLVFDDTLMIVLANQAGRVYMPMVVRGLDDGLSSNPMVGTYFAVSRITPKVELQRGGRTHNDRCVDDMLIIKHEPIGKRGDIEPNPSHSEFAAGHFHRTVVSSYEGQGSWPVLRSMP